MIAVTKRNENLVWHGRGHVRCTQHRIMSLHGLYFFFFWLVKFQILSFIFWFFVFRSGNFFATNQMKYLREMWERVQCSRRDCSL